MPTHLIEKEETLSIETPERVPLEFALASIGNRFLAVVIDHFIQFLSIFLIAWFFLAISGTSTGSAGESILSEMPKWTVALMVLVLFLVFASYFIFFEWLWNGQTPGKRLLRLRVIREDGRPLTPWEAIARNLMRIGDAVPGFIIPIYSVGLIVIFLNNRDQRLGDIFAGTVVIREHAGDAPTFSETFGSKINDPAMIRVQKNVTFAADITPLNENEIEVVEAFLRRRWDLSDRQRLWMAWRIALPLMYRLKPKYEMADFSYEGFLEELLHRFRARQRFLD